MTDVISVSAPPFLAAGDGVTNDRAAIQSAIDAAHAAGGGTVLLEAGKKYLSGGIVLRSGVTLLFGDGAELYQSPDPDDYVKPAGDSYEKYVPVFGHNFSPDIKWSHNWYHNYPFIFAPEGSRDFAVKGKGTVRMMEVTDTERIMKLCPIGFYRCSDFEISGIHITDYHGYAMMPFTSRRGLIKDVRIDNWSHGNGDGVCLMNCSDIRITGCDMFTGDDAVYIFSSYRDPRKSEWWSSDEPEPSVNIEIDHNDLRTNHCKAFGMILWGIDCEDLEKVEVRDVYVHDNHFETMGNWLYNPYSDRGGFPPVTHVRFENNEIDGVEINFFETQMSDVSHYRCMTALQNGSFEHGRCFWALKGDAGVMRKRDGAEEDCGFIGSFYRGEAAVYQGLYLEAGRPCLFKAEVKAVGEKCRLFVREQESGRLVAFEDFSCPDWETKLLPFKVEKSGNYLIGMESGEAESGGAFIRHAAFGSHPAAQGYDEVIFDTGKMIFTRGSYPK